MTDTTPEQVNRARGTVALRALQALDDDVASAALVSIDLAKLPAQLRDYAWADLVMRAAEADDLRGLLRREVQDALNWATVQHGDTGDLVAGAEALLTDGEA